MRGTKKGATHVKKELEKKILIKEKKEIRKKDIEKIQDTRAHAFIVSFSSSPLLSSVVCCTTTKKI